MSGSDIPSRPAPAAACPICGRPAAAGFRPFCSKRCADVDLQRWLSDRYVIPVEDEGPDEDTDGDRTE